MKYNKFFIENYRAIEDVEIKITDSLVPIIGVNELGKTSILKAILAFDKQKDKYNGGEHLFYENKYSLMPSDSIISAEVSFESIDEVNDICHKLKATVKDTVHETLTNMYDNGETFMIARNLRTKEYSVKITELDEDTNNKIASAVYDILPVILYFDDFSDRVPGEITFPYDYKDSGIAGRKRALHEWRSLLEEIFSRGTTFTLQEFIGIEDDDRRDNLLSDVEDILNDEIISEWHRLKEKGLKNIASSSESNLGLKIDYSPAKNSHEQFIFKFKVKDRSAKKSKMVQYY